MSEKITFEKMTEYITNAREEITKAEKSVASARRNLNVQMSIAGFEPNYFAGQNKIEKGEHCYQCKRYAHCAIYAAGDSTTDDAPICRYFEKETK